MGAPWPSDQVTAEGASASAPSAMLTRRHELELLEVVMKNFIVSILEPTLSIFVISYTLIGFVLGGFLGGIISSISASAFLFGGLPALDFHVGWAFAGGIVSFILAVMATGAIFTLLAIRELLEQQLNSLRALERSRQP